MGLNWLISSTLREDVIFCQQKLVQLSRTKTLCRGKEQYHFLIVGVNLFFCRKLCWEVFCREVLPRNKAGLCTSAEFLPKCIDRFRAEKWLLAKVGYSWVFEMLILLALSNINLLFCKSWFPICCLCVRTGRILAGEVKQQERERPG